MCIVNFGEILKIIQFVTKNYTTKVVEQLVISIFTLLMLIDMDIATSPEVIEILSPTTEESNLKAMKKYGKQ